MSRVQRHSKPVVYDWGNYNRLGMACLQRSFFFIRPQSDERNVTPKKRMNSVRMEETGVGDVESPYYE